LLAAFAWFNLLKLGSYGRLYRLWKWPARAKLYSIDETTKVNGLTPFELIMACLDELCTSTGY